MRGTDSSGIVCAIEEKESGKTSRMFRTRKSMSVAPAMMLERGANKAPGPYDIFLGNKDPVSAIIGHCRAATVGEVNISNSHPHSVGSLIGVHNGTMKSIIPKSTVFSKDNKDSDSFQIYKYISEHGVDKFWKEYETSGAFALVWFDLEDSSLNVLRNNQRTLYWCGSYTMYWASERDFLYTALNRGSGTAVAHSEIEMFEAGVLYKCSIWGERKWVKTRLESKPVVPFVPAPWKKSQASTGSGSWTATSTTTTPVTTATSVPTTTVVTRPTIHVPDATHHSLVTASGRVRYVNTKALKNKSCTCDWCSAPIDTEYPVDWLLYTSPDTEEEIMQNSSMTEFLSTHSMKLCLDCANDESVKMLFHEYTEFVVSIPINARLNPEFANPSKAEG